MSVVVFSHYYLTGNEGRPFQVGETLRLDEYDGFFDQALEAQPPGRILEFVLNDGNLLRPRTRSCRKLRERLHQATMITATLAEDPARLPYCHIDKTESFADFFQAKPTPVSNEILEVVRYIRGCWEGVDKRFDRPKPSRNNWSRYAFSLVVPLPTLQALGKAFSGHNACEVFTDFGNWPDNYRTELPMFLDPSDDGRYVRVTAITSNDIDNCRLFDVTDLDEYRDAVDDQFQRTQSSLEAKYCHHLLGLK